MLGGDASCAGLVGDLVFDKGRAHVCGADGVNGDAVVGTLKGGGAGKADEAMFDGGVAGQIITIIFVDSWTDINDGGNLKLQGDADFDADADDTMVLVFDGTDWYEITRASN